MAYSLLCKYKLNLICEYYNDTKYIYIYIYIYITNYTNIILQKVKQIMHILCDIIFYKCYIYIYLYKYT